MSDTRKTGRRSFLKAAAAAGLAGASGAADAQEVGPIRRPVLRNRLETNLTQSRMTASRHLAAVPSRQGLDGLTQQASALLRRESLVQDNVAQQTLGLVRRAVAGLDSNFTGVHRIDLSFDLSGQANAFNCGSNTCGSNTCASNTCGTQTCGSQSCGSHSCTSNTVASLTGNSEIPQAHAQQWRAIQQMNQEMDSRFVELNIIQSG
jgi:hypothetical protein